MSSHETKGGVLGVFYSTSLIKKKKEKLKAQKKKGVITPFRQPGKKYRGIKIKSVEQQQDAVLEKRYGGGTLNF